MLFTAALLATGALLHGSATAPRSMSHRSTAVAMSGAYDFSARDLRSGEVVDLARYQGKVSLVVNVASK